MKLENLKNTNRNIVSGLLYKSISLIIPFIVRTIIIRRLGLDYLGLDSLFTNILQILNLTELGLNSAIIYCMYRPIADGDDNLLCALYNFYRKSYHIIGSVVLIIGLSIIPFLQNFIKGQLPPNVNIYILYFIYLINTVSSYFLFAYKNSLLNAYQRIDVSNYILLITKFCLYSFQILILLFTQNYYLYIIVIPLSTIINNFLTSIWVDKLFPNIKPFGKIDDNMKRLIKHQVYGVFVGKICIASRNSFDSIILSMFIGLSSTAIYNNYYYVMSSLISVMAIFTNSITAGIGNSIALYDEKKNYDDFKKYNFIYIWIGGVCCTCLLSLYQPFMRMWVGETAILPYSSVFLFVIYFFFLIIGDIRATYTVAAGLWWENRYRAILEAILNLILNIVLVKSFGLNGILLATCFTIITINFGASSIVLFKCYFKFFSIKEYFFDTVIYCFTTSFSCSLSLLLTQLFNGEGVLNIIWIGIVSFIVSNLVFYFVYKNLEIYMISKTWLKESLINLKKNKVK